MKSLMLLWKMVAMELATGCHTSATMDWKTIQGRCKHEGLSFLTITLPSFGKDFEKSLDQARVDRNLFQGYAWKGGLPKFLSGFLGLVFDRTSGVLLDEPNVQAIHAIRQLTLMFSKISLDCTPEREQAAYDGYIQCEKEVKASDSKLTESDKYQFSRMAGLLFSSAFAKVDKRVYDGDLLPKHGPGATAEKLTANGKYRQSTWPERLEGYFPIGDMLLANYSHWELLDDVSLLEPGAEIPVRVISVPKTMKTPRIIGIEPCAMQYAQQAVLPLILEAIQGDDCLDSFLGFTDQVPNQDMAREGSLSGSLATLDLSEASDRVSNQHVRRLFANHPHLGGAVDACRSRKADVPGHGVIRLAKFASMGSALCFPVEAMVFLTVVMMGIEQSLNTPLSRQSIRALKGSVRIYGDDIIVPVDHVSHVVDALHRFGFVVNVNKSFWTGRFRESCGKEYYAGDDISIVKVRNIFPTQRKHVTEVISLVSLRNQLYTAGLWKATSWLDDRLRNLLTHFPQVEPSSPVLGRHSFLGFHAERMHEHLHSPVVKGYRVSPRPPIDRLEGHGALLKCLLAMAHRDRNVEANGGSRLQHLAPSVGNDHLTRAGRAQAVDIKLGWSSPY